MSVISNESRLILLKRTVTEVIQNHCIWENLDESEFSYLRADLLVSSHVSR